ncbi:tetratricopeptide repeat protein [Chryseobacterium sp. WG14]|uniref:tetratricopeptide repeat protein n=1 Tax=Chryseobacterium sp. WG14 TaxID=2926909 RepID=UPI00211EA375|nr:tetratricopeptide repeat protein [Chryseobacterium sp. WG14]MCQ9640927.1 tetratricopeptide repeat protein [Chryseobacterium sp. WG14]
MKNIKIYTLCIGLLLVLFSCRQNMSEEQKESFDTALLTKNDTLLSSGVYESVVHLNIEYLKKAENMEYTEGKGLCYLNIAKVNVSAGNYVKALFFFQKAEKALLNSKNGYHKALFYDTYSKYYFHLKLYDKALEYNDRAFRYVKAAKKSKFSDKLFSKLFLKKGIFLIRKRWLGAALKCYLKGNALENSAFSNSLVAEYYLSVNQLDNAGIYVSNAKERIQNHKISNTEALWVYYVMGYYYIEINNYEEAERNLNKALEVIKIEHTHFSYVAEVYQSLAELYKKMDDEDKAYYYLEKYTEEQGKTDSAQFATMNKTVDDFIAETKNESDWSRNKLPLAIALSIAAISISGVYVRKIINRLRLKKRSLKKEADELKNHVHTKQFQEVVELAKKNDSSFLLKFKELYPDFVSILLKINPDLENSELTFCAMLKLRLSSKEIADYTFVQHRSVQQKKYRIRKRLNIPAETDIYDFFDGL